MRHRIEVRFYEELNDFLPVERKKKTFTIWVEGNPSVKDVIESQGVPHTEIDLILLNGRSVGFDERIVSRCRLAVYPKFESLDISPLVRLRPEPLRRIRFVLDVHLGKLARMLRLLGFDASYQNGWDDATIARISVEEKRIVLTTDRHLLKRKCITHGYWVRSRNPQLQIREVLTRFDLAGRIRPFSRCLICNRPIHPVPKETIAQTLPPGVAQAYEAFHRCDACGRLYWKGSHWERMSHQIEAWINTLWKGSDQSHRRMRNESGRNIVSL